MIKAFSHRLSALSLLKFAFPTILMSLVTSVYAAVDGIFVARFVGTAALSALNLTLPLLMTLISVSIMLAAGGSALVSRQLGEQHLREARANFSALFLLALALGGTASLLGYFFLDELVSLLGAEKETMQACREYLAILLPFSGPILLQSLIEIFLIASGKPALGFIIVAMGGLANILFDALFICLWGMGISGAAWGTALGYSVTTLCGLFHFLVHRQNTLHFVFPACGLKRLCEVVLNGSSEMLENLSCGLTTYLFNIGMLALKGTEGVAAISVILYVDSLLVSLFSGYAMGVAPLASFSLGEGNREMLRKIRTISLWAITAAGLTASAATAFFASRVVALFFPPGSAAFNLAVEGLPLFALSYIFLGLNIYASSLFTALSKGKISLFISSLHTLLFLAGSIVLLPRCMGVAGMWLAIPIAECLTFTVTLFFLEQFNFKNCSRSRAERDSESIFKMKKL